MINPRCSYLQKLIKSLIADCCCSLIDNERFPSLYYRKLHSRRVYNDVMVGQWHRGVRRL
jgi:hypothetical protein